MGRDRTDSMVIKLFRVANFPDILFRILNLVLLPVRRNGTAVLLNGVKHNKSLFNSASRF